MISIERNVTGKAAEELDKKIEARKERDKRIRFMEYNGSSLEGKFWKVCKRKGIKYVAISKHNAILIHPGEERSRHLETVQIKPGEVYILNEDWTKLVEITNKATFEKKYKVIVEKVRKVEGDDKPNGQVNIGAILKEQKERRERKAHEAWLLQQRQKERIKREISDHASGKF